MVSVRASVGPNPTGARDGTISIPVDITIVIFRRPPFHPFTMADTLLEEIRILRENRACLEKDILEMQPAHFYSFGARDNVPRTPPILVGESQIIQLVEEKRDLQNVNDRLMSLFQTLHGC